MGKTFASTEKTLLGHDPTKKGASGTMSFMCHSKHMLWGLGDGVWPG